VVVLTWGRETTLLYVETTKPVPYADSADGAADEGLHRLRVAATRVVMTALAVMTTKSETVDTTDNVVLVISMKVFTCVVKTVTIDVFVAVLTGTGIAGHPIRRLEALRTWSRCRHQEPSENCTCCG